MTTGTAGPAPAAAALAALAASSMGPWLAWASPSDVAGLVEACTPLALGLATLLIARAGRRPAPPPED